MKWISTRESEKIKRRRSEAPQILVLNKQNVINKIYRFVHSSQQQKILYREKESVIRRLNSATNTNTTKHRDKKKKKSTKYIV